jgi:hypothetical protein
MRWIVLLLGLLVAACSGTPYQPGVASAEPFTNGVLPFTGAPTGADTGLIY